MSAEPIHLLGLPKKHKLNADHIADVLLAALANGDVLTYELATQLWKNKPLTLGKGFSASLWANLSVPTATWTYPTLTEAFDDYNEYTPATQTFTPQLSGRYLVAIGMAWSDMPDGTDVECRFCDHSVAPLYCQMYILDRPGGAGWMAKSGSRILSLVAGHNYKFGVYQASGSDKTLVGWAELEHWATFCSVTRVF